MIKREIMELKCECKEIEEYKKIILECPHKGCKIWNPDLRTCSSWFYAYAYAYAYAYGNCKRFITSHKIRFKGTLKELKAMPDLYEKQEG